MKCNKTQGNWCKNKHGASKIIDTFETYQALPIALSSLFRAWADPPSMLPGRLPRLLFCTTLVHNDRQACGIDSIESFAQATPPIGSDYWAIYPRPGQSSSQLVPTQPLGTRSIWSIPDWPGPTPNRVVFLIPPLSDLVKPLIPILQLANSPTADATSSRRGHCPAMPNL
jgi:hypothetical protein